MVNKRSEGIWGWGTREGRWRSAPLLPSPFTSLLAPFHQKAQRRASERGWSFKRQLSNFAHKQVNRKVQQKSSHLKHSAETEPISLTTQLHIVTLSASYLEVFCFSYTWNSFYNVTLAAFFSLLWRATEEADDEIQGSVRGEKGGYGIVFFVCVSLNI